MIANDTGILIKDVYTGEMIESFGWKEFSQFHLMTAGRPEDVKRICVIHTTKEFRCGAGEFYIFCLDAVKLLQDLVTQGRGPKQKSLNKENLNKENLETVTHKIGDSLLHLQRNTPLCVNTEANWYVLIYIDNIIFIIINNYFGNNVITFSLRALTHTNIKENIYEFEPNLMYNEEIDSYNRISNTSIASGIYEEIIDNKYSSKQRTSISNMYEETDNSLCNLQMEPPALPPRQRQQSCVEEDRYDCKF